MLGRWAFQLAAHNVFGLFADASQPPQCHMVAVKASIYRPWGVTGAK